MFANLGRVGARSAVDPLPSKVKRILQKYGSDAHLYLPGIGRVNGFEAGNYFDSAGTTLASVDGSVGMVLDAAGSVGAELVTGQVWTTGSANTSISGGNVTVFSGAASGAVGSAAFTVTPGKTYRTTFTVSGLTAGQIGVDVGGASTYTNINSNGTFTQNTVCAGGAAIYAVSKDAVTSASVQIISVREVTGIHASQSTPGHKPTLRKGIVNLLTYSNDLTNAAWVTLNGANKSGQTVTLANTYNSTCYQVSSGVPLGSAATAAFVLSGVPGAVVQIAVQDNGGALKLAVASVTLTSTPTLYAVTRSTTGFASVRAKIIDKGTTTTVNVGGAGLFQGTLTAAQILAAGGIPLTTTAPASSVAGVNYLELKQANTARLQLSSVPFQMADDWCVTGAVALTGGSISRVIYAQAAGGASGESLPEISFNADGAVGIYVAGGGATLNTYPLGAEQIGVPIVVSAWKVGNTITLRRNGVQIAQVTASGTYLTATNAYIGAVGRSTVANFLDGAVYDLSPIKGTLTLADVQLLEKQAAAAAGIQL